MRAISIPVSDNTGVSGFIFPGDHVDLMLTQTVKNMAGTGDDSLKATETVLRNLRVLATDQNTESETVNGKTVVKNNRLVTLEVTPKLAEKIQVAQTLGTLSLALRSIADNQMELDKAIASGSIKLPDGVSKKDEDKLLAEAMNKPIEGNTTFSTGGDVSRFARRGLPAPPPAPRVAASVGFGSMVGPTIKIVRGSDASVVPVGKGALARMQGFGGQQNAMASPAVTAEARSN
jgi:pilus assembly protein CpaB